MRSEANKVNYRYLFRDIVVGFCEVDIEGKTLFVKHLSALDQVNLEVLEEQFFAKAKNRGLPTSAIQERRWTGPAILDGFLNFSQIV